MAKFQSPLLGYNNNVRHKNRVFHIQTEDSGVNHPHIITHLFMDGGRILKSVKTSYAEHVGTEGMKETVRGMMKDQHKAIFVALRDGQFDTLVDPGAAPAKPSAALAAAPIAELAAVVEFAEVVVAPDAVADPPPTSPDPPRSPSIAPPTEQVPMTTREPFESRPSIDASAAGKSTRELTLDFDALERASQDSGSAASLFHATELPPPPKNMFAREHGTGAYRAVEANSTDPREEPDTSGPVSKPQLARGRPAEARYAPARPAAIFGSTQRPPPASLFSDDLVSDKSLDEVILSYLAEDLEPPRRK